MVVKQVLYNRSFFIILWTHGNSCAQQTARFSGEKALKLSLVLQTCNLSTWYQGREGIVSDALSGSNSVKPFQTKELTERRERKKGGGKAVVWLPCP